MPDSRNRIVSKDMQDALEVAERRIAEFQPPAAGPDPPPDPPDISFRPDFQAIKAQVAKNAAEERTQALFELLIDLITQACQDELARQQITSTLTSLQTEMGQIRDILARHNLT